jgi:hypothetical protein
MDALSPGEGRTALARRHRHLSVDERVARGKDARAQAPRSGQALLVASGGGRGDAFDKALAGFAADYADQDERDYDAFAKSVGAGRLNAETGV